MLSFHVLNVQHGDSTVVEYVDDDGCRAFGLIDSNSSSASPTPALDKLRQLGAQELGFVVLTHPHLDHYSGMAAVLEEFKGRIHNFYTFPLERDPAFLKKYAESVAVAVDGSSSTTVLKAAAELVRVLLAANEIENWQPLSNFGARIGSPGFDGVAISLILPPSRVKGQWYERVRSGRGATFGDKGNDLSLAISFQYARRTVVIGGDGTAANWMWERQRSWKAKTSTYDNLGADVCRLPHHGSKTDSSPLVLGYIFGDRIEEAERKIAIISADGKSHPSHQVINDLHHRGVAPYCTSLSTLCRRRDVVRIFPAPDYDPKLVRFLNQASASEKVATTPCQGDITVSIDVAGGISVSRQHENACFYRGEY